MLTGPNTSFVAVILEEASTIFVTIVRIVKNKTHKSRCCKFERDIIGGDILRRIYAGTYYH